MPDFCFGLDSYRSLNLLSVVSNEKAVFPQVANYLDKTRILNPNLHGRPNHSTVTAINKIINTITEALDDKKLAALLMVDQSSAYDIVAHLALVRKCARIGFDDEALAWITSYLSDRSHATHVDGFTNFWRRE